MSGTTSMARYTPGPWLIAKNGQAGATFHVWRNDAAGKGQGNEGYAHIVKHVHGEANANLIAAAPAMYEALQETMRVLRILRDNKEAWYTLVTPELLTAWDKNKAALDQAEGR